MDSHVFNGATEGMSGRVSVEWLFAESKVSQHDVTLSIQHDVFWFEVPMRSGDEPVSVCSVTEVLIQYPHK